MSDFYFLPSEYVKDEHGALGECVAGVLYLIRKPGKGVTDNFTAKSLFARVYRGSGQGGESVDEWGIARWKHRDKVGPGDFNGDFDDNDFLVWVDEESYFMPNWRVYKEAEFKRIFAACCQNFISENPSHAHEVIDALAENGISFSPSGTGSAHP